MKTAIKEVPAAVRRPAAHAGGHGLESPQSPEAHPSIGQKHLINKLNYANFQNNTILVYFIHKKYSRTVLVHAKPKPCMDRRFEAVWVDSRMDSDRFEAYAFQHFLLIDSQDTLLVEPEVERITDGGIHFLLPDTCRMVSSREVERHFCEGVSAQLIQTSALFHGALIDFNAISFRISLKAVAPQRFHWINPDLPVNIILTREEEVLYAGECVIIRQDISQAAGTFVVKPINRDMPRFKAKAFRSLRHRISPTPVMAFSHPLTKRLKNLSVVNLSGSGFSVVEARSKSTLLPGMILPEADLQFANGFSARCKVQVIYRRPHLTEAESEDVICGMVFLDMDVQDHVRLVGLLHQLDNSKSYICNTVDLDKLWNFFFETGFIYPEKYAFIQRNKETIRETYRKLYTENPSIARHFIYQDRDEILGHMAMIRFYENAWLIHHHAATHSSSNRAGLVVLDQIGRFSNDSHNLYSMHMDYLMCYFRPENRFPNRVFGGAARNISDRDVCSLDPFAYLHMTDRAMGGRPLPSAWSMEAASDDDLEELESYYATVSGGLLMKSFSLKTGMTESSNLAAEYRRLGFRKRWHIVSVKKNGLLKGVYLANVSDIGLNLSELTNSLSAFILDPDEFPLDVLYITLCRTLDSLSQESTPVLLFPHAYADAHALSYEKTYNLWILNTQCGDQYFNYINRLLRFIRG